LSNQNPCRSIKRPNISIRKAKNGCGRVKRKRKALEQREIGLEVTLLKAELESEKSKSEFGFNVALGLVRNSVFRKSLLIAKHCLQYQKRKL
jgi:hypothetical protein